MSQGAPLGNEFWKLRTKHGLDKLFTKPDILWEACVEYFKATDARTWDSTETTTGRGAKTVTKKKRPPYTLMGLCIYLDVNSAYFRQFKQKLEGKTDKLSKGFATVIARVEEIIYSQQYEGASVGEFNPNIIARALGLIDKKDITTDGKAINTDIDLSKLSDAELRNLVKLQSKSGAGKKESD